MAGKDRIVNPDTFDRSPLLYCSLLHTASTHQFMVWPHLPPSRPVPLLPCPHLKSNQNQPFPVTSPGCPHLFASLELPLPPPHHQTIMMTHLTHYWRKEISHLIFPRKFWEAIANSVSNGTSEKEQELQSGWLKPDIQWPMLYKKKKQVNCASKSRSKPIVNGVTVFSLFFN